MNLTREFLALDLLRPRPVSTPDRVLDLKRSSVRQKLITTLLFLLLIPAYQEAIGLRLSPIRIFLLVGFVPFGLHVLLGRAGRVSATDILIIAFSAWIAIALSVVHGETHIPFAGISIIEILGAYLAGRVLVRTAQDYRHLFKIMSLSLLVLLPFAIVETLTGDLIIPDLIRNVVASNFREGSAYGRLGLERVYSVFEHPILFGLYSASMIASLLTIYRKKTWLCAALVVLAGFMTFLSLSSAPLLACAIQLGLILWARLAAGNWMLLTACLAFLYVSVDLLSDRTPITILIEQLTFNPLSGWTRIAIFDAGFAAAISHPIFGIGFNDWTRPAWLTDSVDNFWLLNTMRYGFVGGGLLIAAFASHIFKCLRARSSDPEKMDLRCAYLITLFAICFALCTVHVWGSLGVFIMFFLGAGSWFYAEPKGQTDNGPKPYSRFEA